MIAIMQASWSLKLLGSHKSGGLICKSMHMNASQNIIWEGNIIEEN
jgi:hypothetical protein